jgi:hypothetical protein
MTQDEIFGTIESMKKYVDALWSNTTIKVPVEDQEKLGKVYTHLMKQRLNVGCSSCIEYALIVCQSYYEREYPKYNDKKSSDA